MDLIARLFTGPLMLLAGANHFRRPKFYLAIMPPCLPRHRELVVLSGVAEMAGAVASMVPRTRRLGGWFSIATLLAIFPANLHMALAPEPFAEKVPGGRLALCARLPLQAVMIYLVYRATLRPAPTGRRLAR